MEEIYDLVVVKVKASTKLLKIGNMVKFEVDGGRGRGDPVKVVLASIFVEPNKILTFRCGKQEGSILDSLVFKFRLF